MRRLVFCILFFGFVLGVQAQVHGVVLNIDSIPLEKVSVSYGRIGPTVFTDSQGSFSIERRVGGTITFSYVGLKSQTVKVKGLTDHLVIMMKEDTHKLDEVVVLSEKKKKIRYSRKNNPAVDLMNRVIEANKSDDMTQHEYYSFDRYQKITLSLNDITDNQLEEGPLSKKWMRDYMEVSPLTGKRIMRRGAPILAEVLGWGFSGNGDHISTPNVTGPAQSLTMCIKEANINLSEIGYVNAHGVHGVTMTAFDTCKNIINK